MNLKRIYYRILLAVLPSVEDHLKALAGRIQKIDALTNKFEQALEEEVVKLANDAHKRRLAIDSVNATYDKRSGASMDVIGTIRADLEKASEVRDSVAKFLGL